MAEEEDDYMGDLSRFLPSQPSLPPSSSSHKALRSKKNNTQNPEVPSYKKSKTMNWQEARKLKREKQQVHEDQQTLANLESKPIPTSNIGFKMLKQMGYTPGTSLGKEGSSGLAEPVGVDIRRGRGGLGRREMEIMAEKEKERREMEMMMEKRRREEELAVEFGCRVKEQWRSKRVVVNFSKAKGVLEQLEGKDVAVVEKKGEGEDEEEEEEEEVVTEEDLQDILMKLRDEFQYCLFCGCQYESMEVLLSNCPGINEDDH